MRLVLGSWDIVTVWVGALILGGLTLDFVSQLRDRGVTLQVSALTFSVFNLAAWLSWALNAAAATLVMIQPFLDGPLPFNPWILGAASSPSTLPLMQMRRMLRIKVAQDSSARLAS